MKLLVTSLLFLGSLAAGSAFGADPAPTFDLLKEMSAADFRAAGLDHLSDAQLKALSAWFGDYQRGHEARCGADAAAATAVKTAVASSAKPAAGEEPEEIDSYLSGSFKGFKPGARYTLDNGEVWEQTDDMSSTISPLSHPKVTLRKGIMTYYLTVQGAGDSVMVKKVEPQN